METVCPTLRRRQTVGALLEVGFVSPAGGTSQAPSRFPVVRINWTCVYARICRWLIGSSLAATEKGVTCISSPTRLLFSRHFRQNSEIKGISRAGVARVQRFGRCFWSVRCFSRMTTLRCFKKQKTKTRKQSNKKIRARFICTGRRL